MEKAWHPLQDFAWKIPWMEGLEGCSPWGRWESGTTERLHFHFSLSCIGEGNGNPLQCSCLENPRDGGAGWLPSMGSHRVGHDWSDLAAAAATLSDTRMSFQFDSSSPNCSTHARSSSFSFLVFPGCSTLCLQSEADKESKMPHLTSYSTDLREKQGYS